MLLHARGFALANKGHGRRRTTDASAGCCPSASAAADLAAVAGVQFRHPLHGTLHRACASSRRSAEIPGIGPIGATALVAEIGDWKTFSSGRSLAAWIGLVPADRSATPVGEGMTT
jgi:Transposase IS116/IS110/IS902 family